MRRLSLTAVPCLLLVCALAAPPCARADALYAVQLLRAGGCGGIVPAARPLERTASLDRTAQLWAAGRPLRAALARSGYPGQRVAGLHVAGTDDALIALIRRSGCRTIASRDLRDIGVYRRGRDSWVVVGSAAGSASLVRFNLPAGSRAPASAPDARPLESQALALRALRLVNEVRARGARCGERAFPPAPPLRLSSVLAGVASGHAVDMAEHGYFDHADSSGASPADRVRSVGYREQLVGENIAYGTESIDETVRGWLASPGHCENIMDSRFAEMGIGYAAGSTSRRGLYWVQVLAEPRR